MYMGRLHSTTEAELAGMCGKGLPEAQEELYGRYASAMFAICLRYCGNRDDAEDLLHDGFIKIFGSIRKFRYQGAGSLGGWMGKVFVNEAVSRLRKKARHDIRSVPDEESTLTIHDETGTSDDTLENVSPEKLIEMISELPDGCRSVLNLYVFEQKSHKEIARLLGIKENSSTSQLHRAKAILRNKINRLKNGNENRR